MRFLDISTLPVRLGSAIRQRRLFHPAGVLAVGRFERVAAQGVGLPMESCDVVGRISKAIGMPGTVPDLVGVAWRMPPQFRSGTPWDVLLASTVGRLVLRPVTSWSGVAVSSLMPLRYKGDIWWVRGRLTTDISEPGLSLDTIRNHIDSHAVEFDIEQASGTGGFEPLGRLSFHHLDPSSDDIAFDPTVNCDPAVQLAPNWLSEFRRSAYRRSREGRDAE
ncbi:phosphodiesterase [Mycobacterium deserti]|uniref:Phosphodiesterase n=1 Tax=Mycobacterium deserti TaxID=2978347 RepID=A0ABT2MKV9_9MYCO|nr:phosphodiesterase [Mycobacterium deserti]MCT7661725.1 phosphodiesterase [Mycobacterium deserti]